MSTSIADTHVQNYPDLPGKTLLVLGLISKICQPIHFVKHFSKLDNQPANRLSLCQGGAGSALD